MCERIKKIIKHYNKIKNIPEHCLGIFSIIPRQCKIKNYYSFHLTFIAFISKHSYVIVKQTILIWIAKYL